MYTIMYIIKNGLYPQKDTKALQKLHRVLNLAKAVQYPW